MKMNKWLLRFKPAAPKIILIFLGASLWGFASYRILMLGVDMIEHHALNHWLNYLIGIAGFVPFFLTVFRKVSTRYLHRIIHSKYDRPCIFSFFDLRGYILMSLMISLGILVSHWDVIPEIYKGTFFISLGLSLLASAIFYIFEGMKYERRKRSIGKIGEVE